MRPECFGIEFYDESGSECPHHECLLRKECRQTHMSARGLLADKREKEKDKEKQEKRFQKALKKQKDAFFGGVLDRGSQNPTQRKGYRRPARLLYRDEGYPKDAYVAKLTDFLESNGYVLNATKFLHSFSKDGQFLLKVDLRRKNSIVVYIRDDLATLLSDTGLVCRSLYDSEFPNFPKYLCWAIKLTTHKSVDDLVAYTKHCYELNEQ